MANLMDSKEIVFATNQVIYQRLLKKFFDTFDGNHSLTEQFRTASAIFYFNALEGILQFHNVAHEKMESILQGEDVYLSTNCKRIYLMTFVFSVLLLKPKENSLNSLLQKLLVIEKAHENDINPENLKVVWVQTIKQCILAKIAQNKLQDAKQILEEYSDKIDGNHKFRLNQMIKLCEIGHFQEISNHPFHKYSAYASFISKFVYELNTSLGNTLYSEIVQEFDKEDEIPKKTSSPLKEKLNTSLGNTLYSEIVQEFDKEDEIPTKTTSPLKENTIRDEEKSNLPLLCKDVIPGIHIISRLRNFEKNEQKAERQQDAVSTSCPSNDIAPQSEKTSTGIPAPSAASFSGQDETKQPLIQQVNNQSGQLNKSTSANNSSFLSAEIESPLRRSPRKSQNKFRTNKAEPDKIGDVTDNANKKPLQLPTQSVEPNKLETTSNNSKVLSSETVCQSNNSPPKQTVEQNSDNEIPASEVDEPILDTTDPLPAMDTLHGETKKDVTQKEKQKKRFHFQSSTRSSSSENEVVLFPRKKKFSLQKKTKRKEERQHPIDTSSDEDRVILNPHKHKTIVPPQPKKNQTPRIKLNTLNIMRSNKENVNKNVNQNKAKKSKKKFRLLEDTPTPYMGPSTSTDGITDTTRDFNTVDCNDTSEDSFSAVGRKKVLKNVAGFEPQKKFVATSAALNLRARTERQRIIKMTGKIKQPWTSDEETALLVGLRKFGVGQWSKILVHGQDHFQNRTGVQIKDKFRTMLKHNKIPQELLNRFD